MALTGADVLHRVRTALAELGYADASINLTGTTMPTGAPAIGSSPGEIPSDVWYKANALAGLKVACPTCWADEKSSYRGAGAKCVAGDCDAELHYSEAS